MEGTGVAGGLAVLALRWMYGIPYVVSSGDAVGPYVGSVHPFLAPLATAYERLLCSCSAGYIGWSPYLAGRALTFGAPRAITAAGWSTHADKPEAREPLRRELGIPSDAIVFGLVGSLAWNAHVEYCYGLELVRALTESDRPNVYVLIVGGGDGSERLAALAGDQLGKRVVLAGQVPREQVTEYLAAMDVGSLPQSVDKVGMFRYTTKISEYLAARLPVVTGQIPLAYDLDEGWLWRLPGTAPWDSEYIKALSRLMSTVTRDEVNQRRARVPVDPVLFDAGRQQRRVTDFLLEVIPGRG
jgi:glycosyltransferase involved in cell wall biosynthesis